MPKLKLLILEGCSTLVDVHPTIGVLDWLVLLDLKNCKNLASLPSSICELKSLETLVLSGCSKLDKLPEKFGHMQTLVDLYLDGTAVTQPPSSIGLLENLQSLSGCKGLPSNSWKSIFPSWLLPRNSIGLRFPSFSGLCSLRRLDLSDCKILEGAIPSDIGSLSSLKDLNLSKNDFISLPVSLSQLYCLRTLKLDHCTNLQALPSYPSSIWEIDTHNCRSLERLPYPSCVDDSSLRRFTFPNCEKLMDYQGNLFFHRQCEVIPEFGCFDIFLTGGEILKSFSYQSSGSSVSFSTAGHLSSDWRGLALCVVFAVEGAMNGPVHCRCRISDWTTA